MSTETKIKQKIHRAIICSINLHYLPFVTYCSIQCHHSQQRRSSLCILYREHLTLVFPLLQLVTRLSILRVHLAEGLPWVPSASAVSIFSSSPNRMLHRVLFPTKTDQTKKGITKATIIINFA